MASELTGATVELLQTLIRNRCVNDGTADSGYETRNADVLQSYVERPGVTVERWEPTPGRASFVARLEGRDPSAPSLCLMGHTDVVPVHVEGWHRDPFAGELVRNDDGVDEVWGRGAVDMLNLTASMAVAFRDIADRGVRPRGDLLYFAVADEEAGSAHGARWVAEHHPDAIRCDYVLTESGGLHDGHPGGASDRRDGRGEGRRLAPAARPRHAGPRVDAVPHRQRSRQGRRRRAATRRVPAGARASTSCGRRASSRCTLPDDVKAALLDPQRIDEVLDNLPSAAAAAHLHACTHTTFSPNLIDGGVMKANVIPDSITLDVDVRTLPGEGTDEVTAHLRAALGDLADHVEVEILLDDPASISRTDTPLWDALQRAVSVPFPGARLAPQFTVGFTDARVFRELGAISYGAGLFSPTIDAAEFGRRFHGHDERVDVESLGLTVELWQRVIHDL